MRQFVLMKHPLFIRAANIAKFGGSAAKVVITKHGGELYVIKHWLMSDVISGLVNKNPGIFAGVFYL
uniref:Uncharacterized protein n=3 Tax=Vibrionales TaxID=135623 RepID=A0A0C5H247_VIBPH|nr:hypothetical protein pVPH1_0127 [Vibrio parahaemolyticus]APU90744.1 hypothetical protein [Vibrio alginolyticus]APU90960.1 hypothetical protein [Vibrio alginolyticus]APU91185.1 hypothetical protein [Vibrio parahaemolyticus]